MKRTYDFKSIYFGSLVYNNGSDGYYYSNPVALEKIRENLYKQLDKVMMMRSYETGTDEFLSVTNIVPLSSMTDNKGNQKISGSKIKLHLLKYFLNSKNRKVTLFEGNRENYGKQYSMKKNK